MATTRSAAAFQEVHPRTTASPELEVALDRAFAAGRDAWPGVDVDEGDLARYLATRIGEGDDPLAALDALHAADLYLACACASGSEPAVLVFERRLLADLRSYLAPIGAAELADDVRQILLERLFVGDGRAPPKIVGYSGQGQLGAWVRVSAVRIALSLRRGERPGGTLPPDDALEPLLAPIDPEIDALKLRYAAAFNGALRDAFKVLSTRERLLLKLHYVDGVQVEQIAVAYRAHRVSASRWLAAARAKVLNETTRLLRERERLTASEFESVVRLVQSQLELSLRRAVAEP